jgi:hypothetical protein
MKKTKIILNTIRISFVIPGLMLMAVSAKAQTHDGPVPLAKKTISVTAVHKEKEAEFKRASITSASKKPVKGISTTERNKSRRLPKTYDDRKTNRISKN